MRCTKCKTERPTSAFYVAGPTQPQTYGGYRMPCKMCARVSSNAFMKKRWRESPEVREQDKVYRRELYRKDPERVKARQRAFYDRNPGYSAERARRNYATKPAYRERIKRWFDTHPEVRKVASNNRRNVLGDNARLSSAEWMELVDAFAHRCAYCGDYEEHLELDHIIPVKLGGKTERGNVVPACHFCNRRKHTLTVDQFIVRMRDDFGIEISDPR